MSGKKFARTTVREALGLSHEEMYLVDLNLALGQLLKGARTKKRMSQVAFGDLLGIKQPRLALMEAGHPSVSIEAYMTAFYKLGMSGKVGKVFNDTARRAGASAQA